MSVKLAGISAQTQKPNTKSEGWFVSIKGSKRQLKNLINTAGLGVRLLYIIKSEYSNLLSSRELT